MKKILTIVIVALIIWACLPKSSITPIRSTTGGTGNNSNPNNTTPPDTSGGGGGNTGGGTTPPPPNMVLVNGSSQFAAYCPTFIAELYVHNSCLSYDDTKFSLQQTTHCVTFDYPLKGKCNMKIIGTNSGTVYVELIQKSHAFRDYPPQFSNNHYGYDFEAGGGCLVFLPMNEPLRFEWYNIGEGTPRAELYNPADYQNYNLVSQAVNTTVSYIFNPAVYAGMPRWQKMLKTNNNLYQGS